ncbi:MAG: PQQ-binding-like beta-propeller repeat protein, partial [Schleiferiaceae bacterium]|nr:PQQ-binding-like beta-propeller repeat protein [Schleiferiaceae bacterium]
MALLFRLMLLLVLAAACQPEDPLPLPPNGGGDGGNGTTKDSMPLELVWHNTFDPDSTYAENTMQPLVHENKVVFYVTDNLKAEDNLLRCYDAVDGRVLWDWNDWDNAATPNDYMNQFVYQDHWLMDESGDMSIINLNTGQTLWQKEDI